ncbi:MAG TPA: AraC family transcriptional regulator [Gemmatimonadales bacterium]|nr:AraC family transcriptional regulator [Gemmatimonadales bacterium]
MDDAAPRFARRPPSPDLAPWIVCYWSLGATDAPRFNSRILPDGSNDLIVDLSGKTRSFVVGAMPQAEVVTLQGHVDLLGVRFRPGGALPFLHHPLDELTGREVELDALWGRAAGSLADALATEPPAGRIGRLERALRGALERRWEESLVTRAVACYDRAFGAISVRQVASALGVGERRLERAFARCVGLSPKRLARVLRFLRTVRHIGRTRLAGAPLALEAGYADQSHFIREFKTLAGVTPTQFAAERRTGVVQDESAAHI